MTTVSREQQQMGPGASGGDLPLAGRRCGCGNHAVQFYESDAYLVEAVTIYAAEGLAAGEAALIIATPEHQRDVLAQLGARVDAGAAAARGDLVFLDARGLLEEFMVDGAPDPGRFLGAVGPVIQRLAGGGRRVRAFGEMVALLWAAGNKPAAVALEALWNDLGPGGDFDLLCAYPIGGFGGGDEEGFAAVCDQHTRVIPAESARGEGDLEERGRAIARLQQQAAAFRLAEERSRKAEQAVREHERELADLFENAAGGIHQVGPDGTVLWANRAECAMLGYEPGEYIGRHISEFHADAGTIRDIMERLGRGEELRGYEARLRHKDGSVRHVLISSNVLWRDGLFVHTRCFTTDITQRRRAEELLRRQSELLARSNADLEAFAHMAAHDLKEPLRGIRLNIGMLLEDAAERLNPGDLCRLDKLDGLVRRMNELLEATLRYSQVGHCPLAVCATSAGTLAAEAVELLRERLDQAGAAVSIRAPLPAIECDPTLARQVFVNLIANAVKYNDSVERRVEIGVEAVPGRGAALYVRDNGIGIAPEHHGSVFRMFKRLHAEERYGPGTGAGLAIVKKIVDRHGGRIWVESEPGKGTTFYFTLGPRAVLMDGSGEAGTILPGGAAQTDAA